MKKISDKINNGCKVLNLIQDQINIKQIKSPVVKIKKNNFNREIPLNWNKNHIKRVSLKKVMMKIIKVLLHW